MKYNGPDLNATIPSSQVQAEKKPVDPRALSRTTKLEQKVKEYSKGFTIEHSEINAPYEGPDLKNFVPPQEPKQAQPDAKALQKT